MQKRFSLTSDDQATAFPNFEAARKARDDYRVRPIGMVTIDEVPSATNGTDRTHDYGLVLGVYKKPEAIEFVDYARFHVTIYVAQTAVGPWVCGFLARFGRRTEYKACQALGLPFASRRLAIMGGLAEVGDWLREIKGTGAARKRLLTEARKVEVRAARANTEETTNQH